METLNKHIFFSLVGAHGKEQVDQIIERKNEEIKRAGYSLWSARIDKKSKELVRVLPEKEIVWVMCKINPLAKDPVTDEMSVAKKMLGPRGEERINDFVNTTFSTGKNYQAYVVEEYLDLRKDPLNFNLANYISTEASGREVPFIERFKFSRFQNVYGFLNRDLNLELYKEISFVMKLKYPFVVDIR